MGLTWEEAEVAALNRPEWRLRQSVAYCGMNQQGRGKTPDTNNPFCYAQVQLR